MKFREFSSSLFLFLMCFGVFLLLFAFPLYRSFFAQHVLIGGDSYAHLSLAKQYALSFFTSPFAFPFGFTPYHFVLAFLGSIFGFSFVSLALPILLGVLTVLFAYLLSSRFFDPFDSFFITLFLVVSPLFIVWFSHLTDLSFLLFLVTFGFYLYFSAYPTLRVLSFLFLALCFFWGAGHILFLTFILTVYLLRKRALALSFLVSFCFILLFFSYFWLDYTTSSHVELFSFLLSDLGSYIGFSLCMLILAVIGLVFFWKSYPRPILIVFLFSFLYGYFLNVSYLLYFFYGVVIFSALGFSSLLTMPWTHRFLRQCTLFLICLGLLFSFTSAFSRTLQEYPTKVHVESALWLSTQEPGMIFSSPMHADLLYGLSGMHVATLPSETFLYLSHTQRLSDVLSFFSTHNITYIYIDETMKHNLWNNEPDGLLYLLENSERFKKIYVYQSIEIWEVLPMSEQTP